jgi:hypothetical protein
MRVKAQPLPAGPTFTRGPGKIIPISRVPIVIIDIRVYYIRAGGKNI